METEKLTPPQSVEQQVDAWNQVVDLLTKLCPDYSKGGKTGLECALSAINRLAHPTEQPTAYVIKYSHEIPALALVQHPEFVRSKTLAEQIVKGLKADFNAECSFQPMYTRPPKAPWLGQEVKAALEYCVSLAAARGEKDSRVNLAHYWLVATAASEERRSTPRG